MGLSSHVFQPLSVDECTLEALPLNRVVIKSTNISSPILSVLLNGKPASNCMNLVPAVKIESEVGLDHELINSLI